MNYDSGEKQQEENWSADKRIMTYSEPHKTHSTKNQNKRRGKEATFRFNTGLSRAIKILSLIFRAKSEEAELRTEKLSKLGRGHCAHDRKCWNTAEASSGHFKTEPVK